MLGALDALRKVAINGSSVLAVSEAETALLESLDSRDGHVRLLVAEVVSLISGSQSQQALMKAALGATGSDQIDLLDLVAASARRFGNNVAPRQIDALRTLISNSTGDTADAAGRAYGALDVGPEESVKLILD